MAGIPRCGTSRNGPAPSNLNEDVESDYGRGCPDSKDAPFQLKGFLHHTRIPDRRKPVLSDRVIMQGALEGIGLHFHRPFMLDSRQGAEILRVASLGIIR